MPLDQATLDAVAGVVAKANGVPLEEAGKTVASAAATLEPTEAVDNSEAIAQNNGANSVAQAAEAAPTAGQVATGAATSGEGAQATQTQQPAVTPPTNGFDRQALAQRLNIPVERIQDMESEAEVLRAMRFRDTSVATDVLPRLQPQQPPQNSQAVDRNPAPATATAQATGTQTVLPEEEEFLKAMKELEDFDPAVLKAIEASTKAAEAKALKRAEEKYEQKFKVLEEREAHARQEAASIRAKQDFDLLKTVAGDHGLSERLGLATQPGPQHQADIQKTMQALQSVATIDGTAGQPYTKDQINRALTLAFGSVPKTTTGQSATAVPSNGATNSAAVISQSNNRMGTGQTAAPPAIPPKYEGNGSAESVANTPAFLAFFEKRGITAP